MTNRTPFTAQCSVIFVLRGGDWQAAVENSFEN
jgi:hypothetical protein